MKFLKCDKIFSFCFAQENRMYYIKVTLLNYSWRLNADELQFVEKLKEQELEEFRLVPKQELGCLLITFYIFLSNQKFNIIFMVLHLFLNLYYFYIKRNYTNSTDV